MSNQISVTPELIQNEIRRLGEAVSDLEFHANGIHTVTAKSSPLPPAQNFNSGSVFDKCN